MTNKDNKNPVTSSDSKSKILYLDTSTPEATLAIYCDKKLVARDSWLAGRELSAGLVDHYEKLLNGAKIKAPDLDGIVVFVGPGSFTGLRIGLSFANGLAFALGIPVYETKEREVLELNSPQKIAEPFYGAEPNITQPKNK